MWFIKGAVAKADKTRDELAEYKTHVAQTYLPKTEAEIRFDKLDARLDKLDERLDKLDNKIDRVLGAVSGNRRSTDKISEV